MSANIKEKKLKILVVSQYFWPENMRINDLVEELTERGHEVTVLTGLPNYPEGHILSEYKNNKKKYNLYKDAKIIRVPMFLRGNSSIKLILNYFSFFFSASCFGPFKLRSHRYDVIFVYAVSPIFAAIPAIIIGRLKAAPVFLWVLDLWPETLSAVGAVKNKLILQVVGKMVSWIYNRTDYILMQSKSFKLNILKYCTRTIKDERLLYFPSWAENIFTQSSPPVSSSLLKKDECFFTIMFAGNIGESQDFPSILDAFEKLKRNKFIRLVLVGEGRMSNWVQEQIKIRQLNNILLLGKHPVSEMPRLFFCADALLLSLKTNDVFSKTIPGKLQAYLAAGKPIIGMVDGEAANVILESGCGFVGASGDAHVLANNILKLQSLKLDERNEIGRRGIEFYKNNFDSFLLFNNLERLFQEGTLRRKIL